MRATERTSKLFTQDTVNGHGVHGELALGPESHFLIGWFSAASRAASGVGPTFSNNK